MICLKVDALKPGMILARSVHNQQGLRLLQKDSPLTKKRIWMLKTWGIDRVSIKGQPKEDDPTVFEAGSEARGTIARKLKAKFADVIDDPVMEEIMNAACRQLQKNLSEPDRENEAT